MSMRTILVALCLFLSNGSMIYAAENSTGNEIISDSEISIIEEYLKRISSNSNNNNDIDVRLNNLLNKIDSFKMLEASYWVKDSEQIISRIENSIQSGEKIIGVLETEIEIEKKNSGIAKVVELEKKVAVQKDAVAQFEKIKVRLLEEQKKYRKFLKQSDRNISHLK